MKCNFIGCDKPQIAKGYCMTHYRRILRNGTLELKLVMNTTVCQECGGSSKNWRKGLCDNCYSRKYKNVVSQEDIFKNSKEWNNYSPAEMEIYVDKIFRYYRKHGFPYIILDNEKKRKEFDKLLVLDGKSLLESDKINQTMHCLGLGWSYFPHHVEICCNNRPSSLDYFKDDKLFRDVIRKRLKIGTYISDSGIRKALKISNGVQAVSNFRPSAAKCIYDTFLDGDTVYDFSCGFGGRLLGALASSKVKRYIGVDPSTKTYNGLQQIKDDFSYVHKTIELYNVGSEEYVGSEGNIDLCFSSPPYFNLEKYSDEETQSYIKFPDYYNWLNGFVDQTVKNCVFMLRVGGRFIVNIAPTKKIPNLDKDYVEICLKNGLILEKTIFLTLSKMVGTRTVDGDKFKTEPIYIFSKA